MTESAPRLVIFDVDGTLIDSQNHILAAMGAAFAAQGLAAPSRADTLAIVGLSLPVAVARLAPEAAALHAGIVAAYKDAFASLRAAPDGSEASPLFPGARAALEMLAGQQGTVLAVATGKSRRGLDHVFEMHDLRGFFVAAHVADDHPSKPHPSMVAACLRDTGVPAARAVIVGDTTYDIDMGLAAGIHALGVTWGYHAPEALAHAGAAALLPDFDTLPAALDRIFPSS